MSASRPRNFCSRFLHRPAAAVLVVALFGAMVVSTAAVAEARPVREHRDAQLVDRPHPVEDLRLGCATAIVDDERSVRCRWSASSRDNVRAYQLYRIVNGAARELIATVPTGERLGAFDDEVGAGDRLVYGVVAVDGAGRVIGLGGPVRVGIPG